MTRILEDFERSTFGLYWNRSYSVESNHKSLRFRARRISSWMWGNISIRQWQRSCSLGQRTFHPETRSCEPLPQSWLLTCKVKMFWIGQRTCRCRVTWTHNFWADFGTWFPNCVYCRLVVDSRWRCSDWRCAATGRPFFSTTNTSLLGHCKTLIRSSNLPIVWVD